MYTCLTMTLTCLTMTLTAYPVGATWVGVLRTPTQVAWEQLLGLRPSPCGGPPNKIVEEGGVCAMVTASPSFVFSKNGLPPLRPPYVCEHPSPATADRSLALGPFEEQPHQLFGKGNRIHGGFPSRSIGMKFPPILWWELYIIYNPANRTWI